MAAERLTVDHPFRDALPFALVFTIPVSVVVGYQAGGLGNLLTPLLVFGLVPLLDALIGVDPVNLSPEQARQRERMPIYRVLTWLCAPCQLALMLWGAWVVGRPASGYLECLALTVAVGISSGIMGINVAHELQHRIDSDLERFLARIMLLTVGYMHWAVEHIAGHHRHVATPRDPATARRGESVYRFLPRSVGGGFHSAWIIETERLLRLNRRPMSIHNRLLRYLLLELILLLALVVAFGWRALPYWLLQSLVAIVLLEVVNYVEHYGLMRHRRDDGHEPVRVWHSWNSSNWLTNRFLFNLQRHSDHHFRPGYRYQLLRHHAASPQLPTGYAGMIVLALIPPLWRRVMDHRVLRALRLPNP